MKEKKRLLSALVLLCGAVLLAGCGERDAAEEPDAGTEEAQSGVFFLTGDSSSEPVLEVRYAETEEYPLLAAFLAEYFGIPEEECTQTQYYYNYFDLNEDGTDEIIAAVTGEYMEDSSGHPVLILERKKETEFTVLGDITLVHTPVIIDDEMTNGWHNVIFPVYGGGITPGYIYCRYVEGIGYLAEEDEFVEELENLTGIQVLSNNLIDDLDQGNYMTLLPCPDENQEK